MEQVMQDAAPGAVPLKANDRLAPITQAVILEHMIEFERVVWDRGVNSHTDSEAAKKDGLEKPLASGQNQMAFIHEMMERNFGDAWVYGGRISVRYIHPVYAGDVLTAHGMVTGVDDAVVTVMVWCENQHGVKTSAGTAHAAQPVAACSWLK
jgi:acyl dehydratase